MAQQVEFFAALADQAEHYVAHHMGIAALDGAQTVQRSVRLLEVTAFIQVCGAEQGGYLLSVDTGLAHEFVVRYMADPPAPDEIRELALEVTAEISNVILGNSLMNRDENDIAIGNPLMLLTNRSEIKPKSELCHTAAWRTEYGSFEVVYFPMKSKAELASILPLEPGC